MPISPITTTLWTKRVIPGTYPSFFAVIKTSYGIILPSLRSISQRRTMSTSVAPMSQSSLSSSRKIIEDHPASFNTGTTSSFSYQPYLQGLHDGSPSGAYKEEDWTFPITQTMDKGGQDRLYEARLLHQTLPEPLKVLVLYGSLRNRSFSKFFAYEAARILHHLGCDVRVFDPKGLPLKDDDSDQHPKVQELRGLVQWSQAHFWCSPEQHGMLTGIFKLQLDHIPLSLGSVRPTQGKTLAVSQVNGGSQSFNAVNSLRILGRWMRMFTIPNQASLPKAWTQFTASPTDPHQIELGLGNRLIPSSNRDRLVDVVEELVKVSVLFHGKDQTFSSRFSERTEKETHGRLISQDEKEKMIRQKEQDLKNF